MTDGIAYQSQYNTYGGNLGDVVINTSLNLPFLTPSKPVLTDAASNVVSGLIDQKTMVTGTLPIANGGTNSAAALSNGKLMVSAAGAVVEGTSSTLPTFQSAIFTNLAVNKLLGTDVTGLAVSKDLNGTANQVLVGVAGNILTLSTPQDIATTSTPTFAGAIFTSPTVNKLLGLDGTGTLVSKDLAGTANQVIVSIAGNTFTFSTPQDIGTGSSPTFAGATFSGLTASRPVKTTAGKALTSGLIDLTADVTGVLPAANGGFVALTAAAVGSAPNANGVTLASNVMTLQPASSTLPGVWSAAAQSLYGFKTLVGDYLRLSAATDGEFSMATGAGNKPGMYVKALQNAGNPYVSLKLGSDLGTTDTTSLRIEMDNLGNASYITTPGGAHTFFTPGNAATIAQTGSFFQSTLSCLAGFFAVSSANFVAASNQLTIRPSGSGNSFTVTATNPAANRTYTVPDFGADGSFAIYRSGAWTPAITFGGASTGITYSSRTASYTQIANIVFFIFDFTFSSKGTATGLARLTGFPFNHAGVQSAYQIQYVNNMSFPANQSYALGLAGGTTHDLFTAANNGGGLTNLLDTNFTNLTHMQCSGFYTSS